MCNSNKLKKPSSAVQGAHNITSGKAISVKKPPGAKLGKAIELDNQSNAVRPDNTGQAQAPRDSVDIEVSQPVNEWSNVTRVSGMHRRPPQSPK